MTSPAAVPDATPTVAPTEYLLRLADDRLVLGHRLSEWCGHAPILEEDIALANVALDLVGHATALLTLAAQREGQGRSEDDLAFLRDAREFRNVHLVELPRGDFAFTIVRQFLFDAYGLHVYEALQRSVDAELAAIAAKAHKEIRYHVRHSGEWMLRLGDGTTESHDRMQAALDELWRFTAELWATDELDAELAARGIAPELGALQGAWREQVAEVITAATLTLPADRSPMRDGRRGIHTEHLGHMLAEMQSVARAHPGATW